MIRLDKTEGLAPRLRMCPSCGDDNGEIALLGDRKYVGICPKHGKVFGVLPPFCCPAGGCWNELTDVRVIGESERIPGSECKTCRGEREHRDAMVAAGGVYFRCSGCGRSGAIKPCDFAQAVRDKAGIQKPNAVGVLFEKCVEHGGSL